MSRPLNSYDESGLQHFIYVRTKICQVKSWLEFLIYFELLGFYFYAYF
jgi:hypothetical protein